MQQNTSLDTLKETKCSSEEQLWKTQTLIIEKHCVKSVCSYSELFWSAFVRRISPYSVRIRENADQNNSECGHFLCSEGVSTICVSHR